MRKINFLLGAALTLVMTACNLAGSDDYANMARDTCDCVNKHSSALSEDFKNLVINSNGDMTKFQNGMTEYMEQNPEKAMELGESASKFGTDFEACMETLKKKYDNVYSHEDEKTVQNKLMDALKSDGDCKFTYALMKIGLQSK
jgi:hypothetical protein